ncbi:tRNA 5'-guanylyltransferase [Candidatus Bathyarchaeota archaeon]|nr:tRNA 5'-guanylyltransferase [Candidatus Bathyarchaeota archaeon]
MPESSLNSYRDLVKTEIFSKTLIPLETPFFVRLDGWKFRALSEKINAEKPFDKKFAECLVNAGKTLFGKGLNPTLVHAVSDELNVLFAGQAPFRGRIEKIDSVIPSLVSSAFTLRLHEVFGKAFTTAFDSRIVITLNTDNVVDYLSWRQTNAWRNHNNAYAYWILKKAGHKPTEISKRLKGMGTKEIHDLAFKHGVNLTQTPLWQKRGILVYKEPYVKRVSPNKHAMRWRLKEEWNLPLFASEDGAKLIQQILEWVKSSKRTEISGATRENAEN